MTNARMFIGLLGILALAAAGCGDTDDGGSSNGAIVVQKPPGSPPPVTYEGMCRHYCEALERTVVYHCLVSDTTVDACTARFAGWADECEELRCAPRRVEPSLCLVQCDALAANYTAYCEQAQADPGLCAESPAAHDVACRAGCGN